MGKMVDIVGHKYGRLMVISHVSKSKWLCKCDCGNTKIIHGNSLKAGLTKSCGCYRKEELSISKLDDIIGLYFGDWEVISYSGKSKWLCKCSCGLLRDVKAQSLKSGKSTSCGHNTTGFKDLTGQIIKGWEILQYNKEQEYVCKCIECSEERVFSSYALTNNLIGICKCSRISHKLINITGIQFGELKVIKYMGENRWLCECTCGNKSIHLSHNLRRSDTISCGCKEITGYKKEDIIELVSKYKSNKSRLPYRFELEDLLDRSQTSVERYIQKYNLYEYINSATRSRGEEEILKLFPTKAINFRHILKDNKELDLLYMDEKIAIEFNGIYWHSTLFKDKNYHQNKTIECHKMGIHLVHIFEYEWNNTDMRGKIIDYLSLLLNKKDNNVIQARKTKVTKITNSEAIDFCNKYHLQGGINSVINVGLFSDTELIGVMTFGTPRFATEFQWELLRMCFKPKTIIIGGAEKMFKQFKTLYTPKSIITYSDISKFTGYTYTKLGFNSVGITEPNYVWCNSKYEVLTRYQTQKHKLLELGLGNSSDTEEDIMSSIGYYKIYDSGNIKLEWKA